jgi:hypothetical protein
MPTPNIVYSRSQKPAIPAPVVANLLVGGWTPPPEFGTLISGPISFTPADWVGQEPGYTPTPQCATTLGQVLGKLFFWWGTYGEVTGSNSPGYLAYPGTPYDSLPDSITVDTGDGTASPVGQPFTQVAVPNGPSGSVQTLINEIQAALETAQTKLSQLFQMLS